MNTRVLTEQEEYLYRIRHSTAHIMAYAVQQLFDDGEKVVRLAIGPPIDNEFYYDMEVPRPITPDDFPEIEGMVYTVGNEQDYHFQVLFKILKRLGYKWANNLFHLSYGMVDLPTGKMKSREGKVIDADDLVLQLIESVKETSHNLGKFQNDNNAITEDTYRKIALGALKYFILKVDPKKRILFNPEESIDLSGNTGPFIQYTYVRIHSILNKLEKVENSKIIKYKLNEKEKDTIKCINRYNDIIKNAKDELSPAIICNYLYDLVKTFNSLYQNHNILSAETPDSIVIRTQISFLTGKVISKTTDLLGIELPDKM